MNVKTLAYLIAAILIVGFRQEFGIRSSVDLLKRLDTLATDVLERMK